MGFLEDIANKIRVWADSRYAPIGSSGGGLTIENNGTALPERSQLNIVGKNLFSSDANENKMLLFQELPKDMRFEFNNHAMLDNVWLHTDGYWYIVGNVYRSDNSSPFVYTDKIRIVKTQDWTSFETVFEYTKLTLHKATTPRIVVDATGNIIVVGSQVASSPDYRTFYFWEAATQTVSVLNLTLSSSSSNFANLMSMAVKSDGTVGLVGFGKNGGSNDQLFYVERSPGVNGILGAKEWIGDVPIRAAAAAACLHLFYGSDGEPRIVFLNNAAASTSMLAVAKKASGSWTVYTSASTGGFQATMMADNNIVVSLNSANCLLFNDSTNSYSSVSSAGISCCSVAATPSNLYVANPVLSPAQTLTSSAVLSYAIAKFNNVSSLNSLKYMKHSMHHYANHILPQSGISFFIMYNRQRLNNAYALMFRMDGSMFMEAVTW